MSGQEKRSSRKLEHLRHALKTGRSGRHGFADVRFVHNCIPESNFHQVNLSTRIGELSLSSPIILNAMTGGAPETTEINRQLARTARESGLAMAVGSQMAALKDPLLRESYTVVRKTNPDGVILANLGGEATVDQARQAVEMIGADALQIHLNVVQELTMPEGDRSFEGTLERIRAITAALSVPVIVKEVGFGISMEAAGELTRLDIAALDVGGAGGTNFARIENRRAGNRYPFFNDWGLSTVCSLLETCSVTSKPVIATGGIRDGADIAKCLALGACAVGIAGRFLHAVTHGGEKEGIRLARRLHEELTAVMTALGVSKISQFSNIPVVITGETHTWCQLRGIPLERWARRRPHA